MHSEERKHPTDYLSRVGHRRAAEWAANPPSQTRQMNDYLEEQLDDNTDERDWPEPADDATEL
jgi:hypothetical protein